MRQTMHVAGGLRAQPARRIGRRCRPGGLGDVAAVALHRLHHQLECRIDDGAGVLRVEVLDQVHRSLDVCEQRGDGLALTVKVFRGRRDSYSDLGLLGPPYSCWRCSQGRSALAAEFFRRLDGSSASRTLGRERRTALGTEFPPFSIVSSALGAAHCESPLLAGRSRLKRVSASIAKARFRGYERDPAVNRGSSHANRDMVGELHNHDTDCRLSKSFVQKASREPRTTITSKS